MSEYPEELRYSKSHIWVMPAADQPGAAYIGITDFLTEELPEMDCIDLPMVGDEFELDALCIHIHIGNRIRHFRTPLTGRVLEVNQDVLDDPGRLYVDWQNNWLIKMEYDEQNELDLLMSASQYAKYLDNL